MKPVVHDYSFYESKFSPKVEAIFRNAHDDAFMCRSRHAVRTAEARGPRV